jgi:hypothetical protein
MSDDKAVGGVAGFAIAVVLVFVMVFTVSVARCTAVIDIANDCDDYGKFENDTPPPSTWYECQKLPSAANPSPKE